MMTNQISKGENMDKLTKALNEVTTYQIQVDGGFWSIRSKELAYDIELNTSSGGVQHNLLDEKSEELQSCCEAVIASMIHLHKILDENRQAQREPSGFEW